MPENKEYSGIIAKLDTLANGQSEIEKNIVMILERMDQRDTRYQDQFKDFKNEIDKACEGRKVLHKKQDDFENTINSMIPIIEKGKVFFDNVGKILWGIAGLVFIAILVNSLPAIIERLK